MLHLLDQSADALRAWFTGHGEREYRAGQVLKWLFEKRASTFEEMTDLPKPLRDALAADFRIFASSIATPPTAPKSCSWSWPMDTVSSAC